MPDPALFEQSIDEFLQKLASDAPTPGGGSVAALTGALAADLGRMACTLTIGKPKFADVEEQVKGISAHLGRSEMLLRKLCDEDAAAYAELNAAFRLPKDDPQRAQRVREGAALAAAVPLETVAVARHVFVELMRLSPIGNPNLKSDVECAQHLARAAMHAAAANVRVNLPFLDEADGAQVAEQLTKLLDFGD